MDVGTGLFRKGDPNGWRSAQRTCFGPACRERRRQWIRDHPRSAKLGFISFGGPAGQIAVMHTELVERKQWIDEQRFLHALNFCMLLP